MLKSILMSMGHQIIICPVANALVRPGLTAIFINMQICHIAVLKHTLNTDLSPLTYTVHFIVVYTNISNLLIIHEQISESTRPNSSHD